MKRAILIVFVFAFTTTALASEADVLKARRKAAHCNDYLKLMQTKSNLEVQVPSVRVTYGKETTAVKPSDETLRLGMKMKAICEAYTSDPKMTFQQFLDEIHLLEDKQRQIEKHFIVSVSETLHATDKATVTVTPAPKKKD